MHHRLLVRQLQRLMGNDFLPDERWNSFLELVSNYYHEVDRERGLLENALTVNNEELEVANTQLRAKVESEEALLRSFTNSIPEDLFFAKSMDGLYTLCNEVFAHVMGMTEKEIVGKSDAQLLGSDKVEFLRALEREVLDTGKRNVQDEWITHPDGSQHCIEMLRAPYFGVDGKPLGLIGIGRDITDKKQVDEKNYKLANFDSLTGLPNRHSFFEKLEHEIRQADRARLSLVLLLIDLDQFKEINDTLGHLVGDLLLVEAASRISACTRESDTVARLQGDEFTVILSRVKDLKDMELVAQKIIERLGEPFQLSDSVVYVSASIGISVYPQDATEVEELLKSADDAMYEAKRQGRNRFSHFTPGLQTAPQERLHMITDLRAAILENQFHLHYQPIMDMVTGHIRMAEALVRWDHPTRGIIMPRDFIPLAEETGLIVQIGDWVFHEAARWAGRWNEFLPGGFQVCVNISAMQFRAEGAASQMKWIEHLKTHSIPGKCIVVEITEGVLLNADEDALKMLANFRNADIQVAIDDFGTGYSSLAYLTKFDIEYLKIDKSFINSLSKDVRDTALCEAILVTAKKLGLQVVAMGVENHLQNEMLDKFGCDFVQGYLYSRPILAEQLDAILRHGAMGR
ncbi:MAG: EAL domain-containing protein [Phycisphaerales bacterium]|nr:EAL domain-containing protein [Phycisphaerales bacterium]